MRLGDFDALKEQFIEGAYTTKGIREVIDNAPTVPLPDFKEGYKQAIIDGKTNFSRSQGEWINTSPYDDKGECSLCCYLSKKYYKFCPNCGTKMKGD